MYALLSEPNASWFSTCLNGGTLGPLRRKLSNAREKMLHPTYLQRTELQTCWHLLGFEIIQKAVIDFVCSCKLLLFAAAAQVDKFQSEVLVRRWDGSWARLGRPAVCGYCLVLLLC